MKILCINAGVCSSWGRKYDKHLFYSTRATKKGHQYCLNCGMTRGDIQKEEGKDWPLFIDKRIVDLNKSTNEFVFSD